ncbi:Low-affinity iron/zinc ion transport protein [Dirofilaria immitis]
MSEETDNIESIADKSNITVANKPNLMIYPADFQVSSNERASASIPITITITSSGDTIIKSFKHKHQSNEIFKRRVAKMAIAPVNAPEVENLAPEVENPSPSTAGYESKTEEQAPSESGQYGKRRK